MKKTLLISITLLLSISLLGQTVDYIDEYGKNYGKGVRLGNITWAPVNCGYHPELYPYGKLYQWGRKYGQGYGRPFWNNIYKNIDSDSKNAKVVPGPVLAEDGNSAENSKYFYSTRYNNWCFNEDSNIWNDGTANIPIKSEYDPCPTGWRVPTSTEVNELFELSHKWTNYQNQNGMLFSNEDGVNVFLPAAGSRRKFGKACGRSGFGHYWTSNFSSISSPDYFSFTSDNIRMGADYKAEGKSVRCVRETSMSNAEVPILEIDHRKPYYKKIPASKYPGEKFHSCVKSYTISDGIRIAVYDQNKNMIISPYRESFVTIEEGDVRKDIGVTSITYTGDNHIYFIVEYEDGVKVICDETGYIEYSKRNARITPYYHNGEIWFTSHHDGGCDLITRIGYIRPFRSSSISKYLDYQYKNNRFYYLDSNKNWIDTQISLEYDNNAKPIQLRMNIPKELKSLFYDISFSFLRQLATQGYLDAIHFLCRQKLFEIYSYDNSIWSIDNDDAEELLPLLEMAYPYHPNCQFYYACLLCGNFLLEEDERKAADASYKYMNKEKAKSLFLKYFSNPNRHKEGWDTPWGYNDEELKELANKAIPGLIK